MSDLPKRHRYSSLFGRFNGRFGKGRCGLCGSTLPPRRSKWCSDRCVNFIYRLGGYWDYWRYEVYKRDRCAICGAEPKKFESFDQTMRSDYSFWVVDHIIPIAVGGAEFDFTNLQLLCPDCNRTKTARDMGRIAKARRLSSGFSPKVGRIDSFVDPSSDGKDARSARIETQTILPTKRSRP